MDNNQQSEGESMRWFKHMSNHQDDPAIAALVEALGWEGYGWYWAIMEKIAASVGKGTECSLEFPTEKWKKILGISTRKLRNFLEISANFAIFSVEFSKKTQEFCKISSHNLLIWKDEYSRKSGQTPKQEEEGEGEQNKTELFSLAPAPQPQPPKKRAPQPTSELILLPDWLPSDSWEAFKQHRQQQRKPMTSSVEQYTLDRLRRAWENGWHPADLIAESCANGWTGVVFDRHLKSKNSGNLYESYDRRGSSPSGIQAIEQWRRSTDPEFESGKIESKTTLECEFVRVE